MARSRTTLNVLSTFYFVMALAFWLGWQIVTDRRMQRDQELTEEQLRSSGMSAWQAYTVTSGIKQAYNNATNYASMVIIIVIMCGQGMATLLISSLPEEKAGQATGTAPRSEA